MRGGVNVKVLKLAPDGGVKSGVTGLFVIEIKKLFSIVLLHFGNGTREAYHSHAFNAVTWFLKGKVIEHRLGDGNTITSKPFGPSIKPKITLRDNCHRVESLGDTWAISFRGPWRDTWQEYLPKEDKRVTLTHGRKICQP